jgi:hypothetical protein
LGAGDHFGGGRHVPDINAQADDWRFLGQNGFNDFERALLKIELDNTGLRAQRTEIGRQIAQSKRRVDVPGIERGENNPRHDTEIINAK